MLTDKLQRLKQLSQRWRPAGWVQKRETAAAGQQRRSKIDGSDSLTSVIRLVNVIRTEIEEMKDELLEIRDTQKWLLVSVDEEEQFQLQRCFADMLQRAKRSQCHLRSLDVCTSSPSHQDNQGFGVKRAIQAHQMTLSRSLLAVLRVLVEQWEKFASAVKLQQTLAGSLGIHHIPDLFRVPRRRSSVIATSANSSISLDVSTFSGWRDDKTVKKQQSEMYHVFVLVSDLASGHDELLDNIEYNVRTSAVEY